ncbi:hypothetical protein GCM10010231_66110 [Streptomyces sindenensis]|nr:hypothetical protein GCM10010231_66110 [Streptomyces sindenensis]
MGAQADAYAIGPEPAEDLDGQVAQQVRDARSVVSGVQRDHDLRVTRFPLASGDQPLDDLADLYRRTGFRAHDGLRERARDRLVPHQAEFALWPSACMDRIADD